MLELAKPKLREVTAVQMSPDGAAATVEFIWSWAPDEVTRALQGRDLGRVVETRVDFGATRARATCVREAAGWRCEPDRDSCS